VYEKQKPAVQKRVATAQDQELQQLEESDDKV
jgi:hypothetical protein